MTAIVKLCAFEAAPARVRFPPQPEVQGCEWPLPSARLVAPLLEKDTTTTGLADRFLHRIKPERNRTKTYCPPPPRFQPRFGVSVPDSPKVAV